MCNEFTHDGDSSAVMERLRNLITKHSHRVVAVGEMGLGETRMVFCSVYDPPDFDRLHFCDKTTQIQFFKEQILHLVGAFDLPLLLHSRNCGQEMIDILKEHEAVLVKRGVVVHSFTGTEEEVQQLLNLSVTSGMPIFISVNGCSLKTEEGERVVSKIPIDRLLLETDAPWCGIKSTHAGFKKVESQYPVVTKPEKWTKDSLVKGRNEPCCIRQVAEIVYHPRKSVHFSFSNFCAKVEENTFRIFKRLCSK
eukprot:Filipodium_phascolosomae@DN2324_c0_g1_i3.p1